MVSHTKSIDGSAAQNGIFVILACQNRSQATQVRGDCHFGLFGTRFWAICRVPRPLRRPQEALTPCGCNNRVARTRLASANRLNNCAVFLVKVAKGHLAITEQVLQHVEKTLNDRPHLCIGALFGSGRPRSGPSGNLSTSLRCLALSMLSAGPTSRHTSLSHCTLRPHARCSRRHAGGSRPVRCR